MSFMQGDARTAPPWIVFGGFVVALFGIGVAYQEAILDLAHRWQNQPEYNHGYLLIAVAIYLMWRRLRAWGRPPQPSYWSVPIVLA